MKLLICNLQPITTNFVLGSTILFSPLNWFYFHLSIHPFIHWFIPQISDAKSPTRVKICQNQKSQTIIQNIPQKA
jgi:hypothetical protein